VECEIRDGIVSLDCKIYFCEAFCVVTHIVVSLVIQMFCWKYFCVLLNGLYFLHCLYICLLLLLFTIVLYWHYVGV